MCAADCCAQPTAHLDLGGFEADPRHAEIIVRDVGVSGAKVTTPMTKETMEALQHEDVALDADAVPVYRSATMRGAYMAQDRPDLQVPVRELARGMQAPTERHWMALERFARYPKGRPRVVQRFAFQRRVRSALTLGLTATMLAAYAPVSQRQKLRPWLGPIVWGHTPEDRASLL